MRGAIPTLPQYAFMILEHRYRFRTVGSVSI